MDKRALRKEAIPNRKPDIRRGVFCTEQIKYVICSAIKNIGGHRTLVLYVYNGNIESTEEAIPRWTMFQTQNEYATLYRDEKGERWLTSMFQNLGDKYTIGRHCAFYTRSDKGRIAQFFPNEKHKGLDCLDKVQERIKEKRSRDKQIAKEKLIIQKMNTVKSLPRDIKGFMYRETLPHYIFYDYRKTKGPVTGYCTHCKHEVSISNAKHKTAGMCPKCKTKITFLSRGKRGYIVDRSTAQVIQRVSDNEIVIRFMKAYCRYEKSDIGKLSVYENARKFIFWDENNKCGYADYYHSYGRGLTTPWCHGDRPTVNKWVYHFEADGCGFLYHRNLDEVLKGTPFQYSAVKEYYLSDKEPLYVARYLRDYLYHPTIEYLVKLGLYRLATYVVYGEEGRQYYSKSDGLDCDGKNICEVLGVEKKHVSFVRSVNPGIGQLKMIKAMLGEGREPDGDLLRWCGLWSISNTESISVPLQYMTPHKLMKYATEHFLSHRKLKYNEPGYSSMSYMLSDYKDYLEMCNALGHDMKSSFVLYPNDLKEAHDRVNDLTKTEIAKEYDRKIAQMFKGLQDRYQFNRLGFMVVPPKSAKDISVEGDKLHHCVGRYIKKVVLEESTILFIRKASAPKKPYCTVEIKNGKIEQARIQNNNAPPPKLQKFIDLWEKQVVYMPDAVAA